MEKHLVKHVIFRLHEKIIGRQTYKFLGELEKLQWATPAELEELKFRKLRALLIHARDQIPFYRKRFSRAGFNPERMDCIDDFKVLPVLTKAEIRNHVDQMTWKNCPGGLYRFNTGGSSGSPLIFYFDRRRQAYDAAARALTHRWWNVDIGDKELYLWGSPVEMTRQDRFKSLRDRITNQLLISAFDVSPEKIPEFVRQFRIFKPKCVFGYPSTLALFCQLAGQQGLRLDDLGVKVVFCTAEVLYAHQRRVISQAFGNIPVADSYGCREGGNINGQCREGAYHVIDPNFVLEYLREGRPVEPGNEGEVTVTHLDAWGMPFIRYNTGDVARPGVERCACGRGFSTMADIQGRTTDFVVTPDGRWQHGLSVIYVIRDIEGVDTFKIIQEEVDDIRVLLKIQGNLYPGDGDRRVIRGLKKRLGEEVRVRIERVEHIPNDHSGKYRYVVSKVAAKGMLSEN